VRQAALECLAVISHAIGPNIALPMIRQFISEEEEELLNPKTVPDHVNASNSRYMFKLQIDLFQLHP
jgi:hypothetical protein